MTSPRASEASRSDGDPTSLTTRLPLTALEIAVGHVFAHPPRPGRLARTTRSPLATLEEVVRPLLGRSPCCVAFSGGRDSSALLAAMVRVARRDGLPLPIAITQRWPGDARSNESDWQDRVIAALGLDDWEIVYPGEGIELLGPEATGALRDVGLLWPPISFSLAPLLRRAAGGTLVTGEGGDEAFGDWTHIGMWDAVARHHRPSAGAVGRAALAAAPRGLRTALGRNRVTVHQEWLTEPAQRIWERELADLLLGESPWWRTYLRQMSWSTDQVLAARTRRAFAARAGAQYAAPYLDRSFLAALACHLGVRGPRSRAAVMVRLFGDLLPHDLLTRQSKAVFNDVFWGEQSRAFADSWDGRGVDPDLVDAERLRAAWLAPRPYAQAALPLHAAYLASVPAVVAAA